MTEGQPTLPDPHADLIGWLRAIDYDGIGTAEAAGLMGMTPGRLCRLRRCGRTPPNIAAKVGHSLILWAYPEVTRWADRINPPTTAEEQPPP
jgi:hypothetical protein